MWDSAPMKAFCNWIRYNRSVFRSEKKTYMQSVGTGFLVLIHIILFCSACQSIDLGLSVIRTCWVAWLDSSLPPHRDLLLIHFILVIEMSSFSNTGSLWSLFKIRLVWAPLSHLLIHKSGVVRVSENGIIFLLPVVKMQDYPGVKKKSYSLIFFK